MRFLALPIDAEQQFFQLIKNYIQTSLGQSGLLAESTNAQIRRHLIPVSTRLCHGKFVAFSIV
jgi:hypothetical protein